MLRHAIAPSARFTKASHDVVRHSRLSSDAKILLLYVQGLPDDATYKPLSELARKLGIKGRAYQKAKEQLVEHGYVHEWRSQGDGGRWLTEQLVANNPLTSEQARHLRGTPPAPALAPAPVLSPAPAIGPPSTHFPTVGEPAPRTVGGYKPAEDHSDKTTPHPPPEPEQAPNPTPEPAPEPTPPPPTPPPPTPPTPTPPIPTPLPTQLAAAERVLLSLRHSRRELHLGLREARALAVEAVKWLERGVSESDLRHALLAERPDNGVRSAVGFLRYRLIQKRPEPPVQHQPYERPPLPELTECTGPGDPHVFRPLYGESECPSCRRAAAHPETEPITWRERIARINGTPTPMPAEA
ncbi:helix-turn-helix domain-containing protein [Streptomyces sp. NBC_01321]|uniref:hypothetical protein n=1 Tax=Streptomyces sp. NBC_01321 TaxID=2903825 RepID=UPI002E0D1A89|nr:helix-turn-helix domain-containing protein [Streptomyces sp. NBC_01321]